jgi:hypothetical protein
VTGSEGAGTSPSRPVVAFAPDLMDRSRIAAAIPETVFVRSAGELTSTPARVVLLDVGRPGALATIPTIDAPVIGFASHVDDELIDAARAAGCRDVLPRSRFFRRLPEIVAAVDAGGDGS